MSKEENKAVLRREVEELHNHTGNLDVVEEIFSPDYVSHEPTSGEVRGIEGARQFAATFRESFPDLETIIEDMVAEGDTVVIRFRGSGTHDRETETFGPPHWRADGDNGYHHQATLRWQDSGSVDQLRRLGDDAAAGRDSPTATSRGLILEGDPFTKERTDARAI
jgi:predicted ester cyclase